MKNQDKKTVKNILLRINLKGYGIVNYDDGDQKWILNSTDLNHMKTRHDNVTYAKKNMYKTPEGKTEYKIKISSDCLKHSIFEKEIPFQSPNISHEEAVLYSFLGSPAYILRGGFHEFGKGNAAFKRKSAFHINDAEQTCNAVSMIETFAKSGKKRTDNSIDDKADNTFFKKETVGEIEYSTEGFVDLEQLQFVSTDVIFDRLAFNPDKFKLFSRFLKTRMPNFNSELGYYGMKDSAVLIPEYGFKFSNDDVVSMVKHLFKCILDLNIRRKSASAVTHEFQYKLVYNTVEDTKYDEKGWETVKTDSDIEKINFEVENFYTQYEEGKAKELREVLEENSKKQDKASADKKQKEKDAIAESKKKKKGQEENKEEEVTA